MSLSWKDTDAYWCLCSAFHLSVCISNMWCVCVCEREGGESERDGERKQSSCFILCSTTTVGNLIQFSESKGMMQCHSPLIINVVIPYVLFLPRRGISCLLEYSVLLLECSQMVKRCSTETTEALSKQLWASMCKLHSASTFSYMYIDCPRAGISSFDLVQHLYCKFSNEIPSHPAPISSVNTLIGASLSEPHTSELACVVLYIYIHYSV